MSTLTPRLRMRAARNRSSRINGSGTVCPSRTVWCATNPGLVRRYALDLAADEEEARKYVRLGVLRDAPIPSAPTRSLALVDCAQDVCHPGGEACLVRLRQRPDASITFGPFMPEGTEASHGPHWQSNGYYRSASAAGEGGSNLQRPQARDRWCAQTRRQSILIGAGPAYTTTNSSSDCARL
jgi:hypothetical protein